MPNNNISGGTVHNLTPDITKALTSHPKIIPVWESLTPLTRNEWICWVTFVKKAETRAEHVSRLIEDLQKGKRRPCCWIGCIHRTDKEISPSVKGILSKRK